MDKEQIIWRRNGIGSSDAAVVMGVSPWRTPYQLWQEKVYGDSLQLDNSSMKRGRDLEETARQEFEKMIGTLVAPDCLVHPNIDWMRASVDGISADKKVLVEIKCPNQQDHFGAVNKKVPEKYWPQVQHQLEVTGLDEMYYFSFDGKKGVIVEVKRDQAYLDGLMEEESRFWQLVQKREAPQLTEDDYICMDDNEEWKKLAQEWLQIKALEDKEKQTRSRLIALSQGRNAKGCGVSLQHQLCSGAVDYSAIPELKGIDLSMYRKKPFEKCVIRGI